MFILQYSVSYCDRLGRCFRFFGLMLVLLCFCVATGFFSVNEDINYFGEVACCARATVAPRNATPRFQVTRTHLESSDNYHL